MAPSSHAPFNRGKPGNRSCRSAPLLSPERVDELMCVDARGHTVPPMTPRTRFFWYAGCSAAVVATGFVLVYTVPYDPDRRPGAVELAGTVLGFVTVPALYGLFAIIRALRGSVRRGFFSGAIAVGMLYATAALAFSLIFNGIDCRPSDCVVAVPDNQFFMIAYVLSLLLAVVAPALLALVRWPRHGSTAS
jgi:hypothetical protein